MKASSLFGHIIVHYSCISRAVVSPKLALILRLNDTLEFNKSASSSEWASVKIFHHAPADRFATQWEVGEQDVGAEWIIHDFPNAFVAAPLTHWLFPLAIAVIEMV